MVEQQSDISIKNAIDLGSSKVFVQNAKWNVRVGYRGFFLRAKPEKLRIGAKTVIPRRWFIAKTWRREIIGHVHSIVYGRICYTQGVCKSPEPYLKGWESLLWLLVSCAFDEPFIENAIPLVELETFFTPFRKKGKYEYVPLQPSHTLYRS